MVDLPEVPEDSVISSASSVEEEVKEKLDRKKLSQSLLKFKLHLMKFTMVAWKKLKSKDIETVKIVTEKVDKMFKNVPNVKVKELFRNLSNLVQECILNHLKDVATVKVRVK